jgi:hypothetical protein
VGTLTPAADERPAMNRARSREVAFDSGGRPYWPEAEGFAQQQQEWPPSEPPHSTTRLRESAWPPLQADESVLAPPRRSNVRWVIGLMGLSFVGGFILRDRLPERQLDGAHALVAQVADGERSIVDRLANLRSSTPVVVSPPASHPAKAAPPMAAAATIAPTEPIASTPAPPEVSFSSLPRVYEPRRAPPRVAAPAPIRVRPAPAPAPEAKTNIPERPKAAAEAPRAVTEAPPKAAVPESPRAVTEAPLKAATESPKAVAEPDETPPVAEAPKPVVAPKAAAPAVVIVPGSLEDLIRKEVQKDQAAKKH